LSSYFDGAAAKLIGSVGGRRAPGMGGRPTPAARTHAPAKPFRFGQPAKKENKAPPPRLLKAPLGGGAALPSFWNVWSADKG